MKIGMKAPTFRLPCIFKDQITFRSLADSQDNQLVLCCISGLTEKDAWFLETQAQDFEQSDSNFGVLLSTDQVWGLDWVRPPIDFSLRVYVDPIGRLQRTFHLSPTIPSTRCETLIFDRKTRLLFRLIHDLNLKGFSAVLDIIESDFVQNSGENMAISSRDSHPGLPQISTSKPTINITS